MNGSRGERGMAGSAKGIDGTAPTVVTAELIGRGDKSPRLGIIRRRRQACGVDEAVQPLSVITPPVPSDRPIRERQNAFWRCADQAARRTRESLAVMARDRLCESSAV